MRDYELGILVSPESSEEQTKTILDRVTQIVQSNGGQVVKVHSWGRRRLAYPIERHRDGFYFFLDLSLTPQTVLDVDRNLKVTEEVIRHLIVKRDPKALAAQRAREAHAAAMAPAEAASEAPAEPLPLAQETPAEEAESFSPEEEPGAADGLDDVPEADDETEPEADEEAEEGV